MKKLTQSNWVFISLAGFLLFILFFYMIITSNNKINLSVPVYFFLIVIIDLIATAFLSGAMRSIARYQASEANKTLYLSGPAVIFFIILYFGYQYRPAPDQTPVMLSVIFTDEANPNTLITEGTASIRIGEFSASKKINEEGTILFTGINPEYKGKLLEMSVNAPGYVLPNHQFQLSDSTRYTNLRISLIKKQENIQFQGRVITLPERIGIADASIRFQGTTATTQTDSLGNFNVTLPIKSGSEIRVVVWKGKNELYNSLRTVADKDYLSIAINN
jgi:hypothetical protein